MTRVLFSTFLILLVCPAALCLHASDVLSLSADHQAAYAAGVGDLLRSHCIECHGADEQSSGIRFDRLDLNRLSEGDIEALQFAREALVLGEMPPAEASKPLEELDRQRLQSWIAGALGEAAVQRREREAQPQLRRLTKREYDYTLQDLFNAPASFATLLPPDPISENGYDTAHELLMVSQVDLKIYMETARNALQRYLQLGGKPAQRERFFIELEDIYHHCRGRAEARSKELAPGPLTDSEFANSLQAHRQAPITFRDRKYGPLPFGYIPEGVVEGVDEGIGFARLHSQFLLIKTRQRTGDVIVRIHAAATQGADGTYPRMRLECGRRAVQNLKVINVGEYDVTASKSKPEVYSFQFRLENALPLTIGSVEDQELSHLFLAISNVSRNKDGILAASTEGQEDLSRLGEKKAVGALLNQALSAQKQTAAATAAWEAAQTNFLYLDAIEIEILPAENDPRNPWSFSAPESPAAEQELAVHALNTFLPQIFRRPLTQGEVEPYLQLYQLQRSDGSDFKTALVDAFVAAMISPSFLYIGHPVEDMAQADSLAYASKLAYFLWSSPPDQRLVDLAADGELHDRSVLAAEMDRMLDDSKSRRLSSTFAEQWMDLRRLDETQIDYELYPEYGPELAKLTKRQTIATFQAVFHSGQDARCLFRSDSMLLNDLLARHYGLPPIPGGDLRLVATPDSKQPGGILTHASILTMNSDGKQSHPVKRGAWLLDRMLADPPPPPPPAVPDLDPTSAQTKNLSLKDRIALHRQQNGCVRCHQKIDPWGVAFEDFDATGRWRDARLLPYPVDASTQLPDGTEVQGAAELASYLLEAKEHDLMRALVKSMMTYATGGELDILDEPEVDHVFAEFRRSGYNMRTLAKEIALTEKFASDFHRQINPESR